MKSTIYSAILILINACSSAMADDTSFAKWEKDIAAIEAKI